MRLDPVIDAIARSVTGVHKAVYQRTGGRLLGGVSAMPVVILSTTGRKSGVRRATMLIAPIVDGDTAVLVASYGGASKHPAWYLNLVANSDVELTLDGITRPMHARTATKTEKDRLWPRIVRRNPTFWLYQLRTSRDITSSTSSSPDARVPAGHLARRDRRRGHRRGGSRSSTRLSIAAA